MHPSRPAVIDDSGCGRNGLQEYQSCRDTKRDAIVVASARDDDSLDKGGDTGHGEKEIGKAFRG